MTQPLAIQDQDSQLQGQPALTWYRCHCGKTLYAPAAAAGKRARCPNCQTIMTVPAESQASPYGSRILADLRREAS